jgi:periplasmic protein TonB
MKTPRPITIVPVLAALSLGACGGEPETETPARQVSASPFEYPEELWDAGVEGRTVLRLLVSEAGTVDSVQVEVPSGYPLFDSAAVAGSHDLQFEPKRVGERPVADWYLLPVDFTLPGGEADGASADTALPLPEAPTR